MMDGVSKIIDALDDALMYLESLEDELNAGYDFRDIFYYLGKAVELVEQAWRDLNRLREEEQ
jgi:hypothetical protein